MDALMRVRRGCGPAGDATPWELPAALAPDGDEAGRMMAVAQRCRRTRDRRAHKCLNTREPEPAKYQCAAAGPRRAVTQTVNTRTHTQAGSHTHKHTHSHSCTVLHSDSVIQ